MRPLWLVPVAAAIACGGDAPMARAPSATATRAERLYRPPADGRLTEAQVQAYVAGLRAPAPGREPEDAAALEGNRASEERRWVRQKVLESRMRLDERAAARREAEIDRKTAEALRGAAAASTDPATRDTVTKQAVELDRRAGEREKDARRPGDPAETANDALVARYRPQMSAKAPPPR